MKLRSKFLTRGLLALMMAFTWTSAGAAERVAMQQPAKDAAYVPFLLGMVNNYKSSDLYKTPRTVNDGIIIRQSTIKDGKIIIPPGGLFVTSRSNNWVPFKALPVTAAGKEYYVITDLAERNVLKDVTLKVGDYIAGDSTKSRGLKLTSTWIDLFAIPGQSSATFNNVKASGTYGGTYVVFAGDMLIDPAEDGFKGTKEKAGISVPRGDELYASKMFGNGRAHVIVDSISKDSVTVREFAIDSTTDLFITPTKPSVKTVKKGDTVKEGKLEVKVLDVTKDSVKVALTDSKGTVEKVLGPANPETLAWIATSMTARDPFWVRSSDGSGIVSLDLYKEGGIFKAGNAGIVVYNDVQHVPNFSPWPLDPRFMAVVDT